MSKGMVRAPLLLATVLAVCLPIRTLPAAELPPESAATAEARGSTGVFTSLQDQLHGLIRRSVTSMAGYDPWASTVPPPPRPSDPASLARDAAAKDATFDQLVQKSGFKIDAVVEGFTPLPMYCIALDKVYFASKEERDAAVAAVDAHFVLQGTRWYDLWSQLEWAFLDFIASFEAASASYASLFNMKMEGLDVHFLPIPYVQVSLIDGKDSLGSYDPPSEVAQLVQDYGYTIVRIDQNLGPLAVLGLDLDATIILRKTHILTQEERDVMRQRIEDYFARQDTKLSTKFVFDYLFFNALMKVHEAINAVGTGQDLEVHDVIINFSLLPSVRTRLRLPDRDKKGYEPPPCA